MGTFLASYGDAGYEHEGYAAQVLDDGGLTGTYSNETCARMVGQVVAACGCGWTGTTRYPTREEFDEAAKELALHEWEYTHARPLLEQVQRSDLQRLRGLTRYVAVDLGDTDDVPVSPGQLAEQLARATEALEAATGLARRLASQLREQTEIAEHSSGPSATSRGDGRPG